MVRAGHLRRVAIAAIAALGSVSAALAEGFPTIEAADFDAMFNEKAEIHGINGRMTRDYCTGSVEKICVFQFRSITIQVVASPGQKTLKGIIVQCGTPCRSLDIRAAVDMSLTVLAPNVPREQYGSWSRDAVRALKEGETSRTILGPVRVAALDDRQAGPIIFLTASQP